MRKENMSKNGLVTAKFLHADDVFRMGGLRYRVGNVESHTIDQTRIIFTSTHPDSDATDNTMVVHDHTIFKIYG
jgi:hypothetical protein